MKYQIIKLNGGIKFFLSMIFVYAFMSLFAKYLVIDALIKVVGTLIKIIPVFFLVFIFMFLSNIYIKKGNLKKHFEKDAGIKGWVYAVAGGIFIAGPPYVLFPMLGELKKEGMADSYIAVLLYNRNVKIQYLPLMAFYFGMTYTIIISVYIIIFSIMNGLVVARLSDNNKSSGIVNSEI